MERGYLHEVTESVLLDSFHGVFAESAYKSLTTFTSERQRHSILELVVAEEVIKGTHCPGLIFFVVALSVRHGKEVQPRTCVYLCVSEFSAMMQMTRSPRVSSACLGISHPRICTALYVRYRRCRKLLDETSSAARG